MSAIQSHQRISDRTLNRSIIGLVLILAVGIPVVVGIYFLDRWVDAGPALPDRNVAKWEETVRQNPNLVSARMALAGFYTEDKRFQDAVTQYTEVLKIDAKNVQAFLGRGNAYEQLNDLDRATADYQSLIDVQKGVEMANVSPQLESAYYKLGAIQLKQAHPADAIKSLVAAVKIDRGDADAMYLLGVAYDQNNQADQAVFALHEAVKFIPTGWCEPYQELVKSFTLLKQDDGKAWATGMADFCTGNVDAAKAALTPLVDGQFGNDSMLGLGYIAERQADWPTAQAMYQKVLAKDASNFNATQGLQRVNAAMNGATLPSGHPALPSAAPASTTPGGNS